MNGMVVFVDLTGSFAYSAASLWRISSMTFEVLCSHGQLLLADASFTTTFGLEVTRSNPRWPRVRPDQYLEPTVRPSLSFLKTLIIIYESDEVPTKTVVTIIRMA